MLRKERIKLFNTFSASTFFPQPAMTPHWQINPTAWLKLFDFEDSRCGERLQQVEFLSARFHSGPVEMLVHQEKPIRGENRILN
jgi:hypothetical protein